MESEEYIMKIERLIKKQPFQGKFILICGGSKGMGQETANLIAQMGGNLCLVARNKGPLEQAQQKCLSLRSKQEQFVDIFACDTTDEQAFKPLLEEEIEKRGVPDYLISAVGMARPGYIKDLTVDDFRKLMEVNYFGQLIPMLAILPHFLKRKRGYYANITSLSTVVGIIGYTNYTPTKFAIHGLIESMRHELKPEGIKFSMLVPPDTQTPGYEEENKTKPYECLEISKTGKIMTAEAVAMAFVKGILKKKYLIYPGDSSWMQFVQRHWPKLVYFIIDAQLKSIQKKMRKMGK